MLDEYYRKIECYNYSTSCEIITQCRNLVTYIVGMDFV